MKKAIIIGAGPAGLTAAYELLKKNSDIRPVIYECSEDIGGISKTVEYKGNRIDIGGHRFFSKSQAVLDLWNEILPLQGAPSYDDEKLGRAVTLTEGGPDPKETDVVMLRRHRVSRILFLHKFFDYPISMKPATFKNMGFKRTMSAGFGYLKSAVHKKKEESLEDYMINLFGKPLYRMFFEDYTTKVWGRTPKEISPDWGKQRIKGLSLWKMVANIFKKKDKAASLIEEFSYPKKGPGQLYEEMARRIVEMGGEIHKGCEVTKINFEGNRIVSVVINDKDVIEGDEFISSMPLKDLYLAMGKEGVPEEAYEVATNLIYRDFITVGLLVNKMLLKNQTKFLTLNNIVPDTWIYVQEREVKLGRLQIFNNWSPYMVKDVDNTVWIGLEYFVNEGDEMWNMDKDKFIEFAIDELSSIGVINKEDVLDSTQIKIKKAYPAYFDSYKDIDKVKDHLNTFENLYCVGRNGQHRYNNMDHSILTAMLAVNAILDPEHNDKKAVWEVNEEKEYHETNENNDKK